MKYNVGDKVRIKSKEWYEANKDSQGNITTLASFTQSMAVFCGRKANIVEIDEGTYRLDIDNGRFFWDDEMFEDVQPEKPTISTGLIKDIAEVVRTHNLGVSIREQDGKLIIEPLKVEEDLPIDTPCMVGNESNELWGLRYYAYGGRVFMNGLKSKDEGKLMKYDYIIPFDKFNPNDIKESLKYNIVKQ